MKLISFSLFVSSTYFCYCFAYNTYNRDACNPDEEVYPCYCTKNRAYTKIECRNLLLDLVKDVLKETKEKKLHLRFLKTDFGDIPTDLFKGQAFEGLRLDKCTIKSFGKKPFTGLENSLKWLDIYGSIKEGLTDFKTFPLSHMKKLLALELNNNDIERVGNDWFKGGPETLKFVHFWSNNIKELGDRAFADLINLQEITLSHNSFSTVSRSMFPKPAANLQLLSMKSCGIDRLPEDIFTDMPVLEYLLLVDNKIKSLPENTWKPIFIRRHRLESIRLSGNPLKCDKNMKWIFQKKRPMEYLHGTCNCETALCGKNLAELTVDSFE